jgi:hypothetical protein
MHAAGDVDRRAAPGAVLLLFTFYLPTTLLSFGHFWVCQASFEV